MAKATANFVVPLPSTDWSDDELSAAVKAYIAMLRCELDGLPYVKAVVNRQLREGPLSGRTKASIEFRMQNISATLYDLRMPRIAGYLPAKNVGSTVKERIRAVLDANGIAEFAAYVPTANAETLTAKVAALRKRPLGSAPPGSINPAQVLTTTATFIRDPAVKRWVLQMSNGICEGCDFAAPFTDKDGFAYLEVHHVMPLASNGSNRISNAAALCPNCHRRCHFGSDRDEFKLSLYEKIQRLRIEVPEVENSIPAVLISIDE